MGKEQSIKSVVFKVGGAKYSTIILGIAFSVIMARLLTPDDYGIFAAVNVLASFIMTASNLGIGAAIIQKKDLSDEDVESIYGASCWIGIILGIAMCLCGFWLRSLYADPVYMVLCPLLGIAVFFYVVNLVPDALLLRDGLYNKVAVRNVVVSLFSSLAALGCALCGGKYYALVLQNIALMLSYYIWNVRTAKLHMDLRPRGMKTAIKKIYRYSSFSFLGSIVCYLELNVDTLLVGPFLGSKVLGLYDKAYRLIDYPVGNLAGVLNSVLHPLLKDYQDEPETISNKYEAIEKVFSLVSILIGTVFWGLGREIILILYGNAWESAISIFEFMSLCIYPKMLSATVNAVFSSLGDTRALFMCQAKRTLVVACCVAGGICAGNVNCVAVFISIGAWVNLLIICLDLGKTRFRISKEKIMGLFLPDVAYMAGMCIVSSLFLKYMEFENVFASAIIKGAILLGAYLIYLLLSKKYKILL